MRKCLLLTLAAGGLHAAIIRGTVVEHQTGKVPARTVVAIQLALGTSGPALSTRTNNYGMFEFPAVPGGTYLVSAARRGAVLRRCSMDRSSGNRPALRCCWSRSSPRSDWLLPIADQRKLARHYIIAHTARDSAADHRTLPHHGQTRRRRHGRRLPRH